MHPIAHFSTSRSLAPAVPSVSFAHTAVCGWAWIPTHSLYSNAMTVSVRDLGHGGTSRLSVCQPQHLLQLPSRLQRRSPSPHHETQLRCPTRHLSLHQRRRPVPTAPRGHLRQPSMHLLCHPALRRHLTDCTPRASVPQQQGAFTQQDTAGPCTGCTHMFIVVVLPSLRTGVLTFCGSAARVTCQDFSCATGREP